MISIFIKYNTKAKILLYRPVHAAKNGQVTPEQNSTTGTGVQNYGFSPLR